MERTKEEIIQLSVKYDFQGLIDRKFKELTEFLSAVEKFAREEQKDYMWEKLNQIKK